MDPIGVRIGLNSGRSLLLAAFVAGGVLLGTISGLTPGIHANTFALLLASVAPAIPGPLAFVGAAMLAAGTVHTFLDVVPALALGVPDPAMADAALPGHRLVLGGRGREALRLSAIGSGGAVAAAVPLAVSITHVMTAVYPTVSAHLSLVLLGVAALLVVTEPDWRASAGAVASLLVSGGLGAVTLDLSTGGLDAGGTLAPLFTGLFGAPVLLDALDGVGVPPQADAAVASTPRAVAGFTLAGTLSGAVVGYLPGVSGAIAATAALLVVPSGGARGFVVTTSGVNTANTVFALFALVALGTPRTGVLVALDGTGAPLNLPILVGSVVVAGAVGFCLVPVLGDRYLRVVGQLPYGTLCVVVLSLLIVVVLVLAGPVGVGIFAAATVVGSIPARFGTRRATLMGVLLVPLALGL